MSNLRKTRDNRGPLTRLEFERIAGLGIRDIPAALQAVGHALYDSGRPVLGRVMARVAAHILLDKPIGNRVGKDRAPVRHRFGREAAT